MTSRRINQFIQRFHHIQNKTSYSRSFNTSTKACKSPIHQVNPHQNTNTENQINLIQFYENGDFVTHKTRLNANGKSYLSNQIHSTSIPSLKCHNSSQNPYISYISYISSLTQSISRKTHNIIQQLLPFGYPHSVKSGYGRFALFHMLSSIMGTVCGVLSMQSLFHAVGIGSNTTLPLAAAVNWILKDGLGQLGGVLFASYVNSRFDADPKRWLVR